MFGAIAGGIASALAGGARSEDRKSGSAGMPRPISTLFPYTTLFRSRLLKRLFVSSHLSEVIYVWCYCWLYCFCSCWWRQIGRSEERFSRNAETDIDTLSLHDALPI